jgi:hypothetical protein
MPDRTSLLQMLQPAPRVCVTQQQVVSTFHKRGGMLSTAGGNGRAAAIACCVLGTAARRAARAAKGQSAKPKVWLPRMSDVRAGGEGPAARSRRWTICGDGSSRACGASCDRVSVDPYRFSSCPRQTPSKRDASRRASGIAGLPIKSGQPHYLGERPCSLCWGATRR